MKTEDGKNFKKPPNMISKKIFLVLLSIGLLINAYSQQNFKTFFVKGYTNNNLEILDWGGKGNPIIFLAGLGNTPHIFEDFAPKFINRFHVYGLTRRGFGKSERVENGFSSDTLALDILKVMDSLSLKKVILIGHSISGDEMTTFARQYPNKILALVFLDAALDHTDASFDSLPPLPQTPKPIAEFVPTLKNIQEDYFKGHRFYFPNGELNAQGNFDTNGLFVDDTTVGNSYKKVLQFVKTISYNGIKCPTLAIYNNAPTAPERFRTYATFDAPNKKIAEECTKRWYKYYQIELERYKKECKNWCRQSQPRCTVEIFLSNRKETETAIKNFLKLL